MDRDAAPPPPLIGLLVRYGLVGAVNTGIGLTVILFVEFVLKASPVVANAARKPCAIAKVAVSTMTTPAIPTTATSAGTQRAGKLRRFIQVTAKTGP